MKSIDVQYGMIFGRGDSSDIMEWEIDLTDEEEVIYNNAIKNEIPLNDVPELQNVLSRAYKEIEEQQIWFGIQNRIWYVLECQGEMEVEPDKINDLIFDRDPHTLAFFGLENATEEELAGWDAYDLDERPLVIDFIEGFKPYSPFSEAWTLKVRFKEDDEENE